MRPYSLLEKARPSRVGALGEPRQACYDDGMLSKFGLSSLTRQQKITLLIFALLNVFILGALFVLVLAEPTPAVELPAAPDNSLDCAEKAAVALRQRSVAASVSLIDNQTLEVHVTGPDAAAAWEVFSMTVRLAQADCGPYPLIHVDVPDPEGHPDTRLMMELTWPQIESWAAGKFDDGQLSQMMRRSTYQVAPIPTPATSP